MKLYLKKSHYNTILTHCTAGLPNESCGLLAGTEEDEEITVTKVYLLTNVDASREHFSMDPKEQLAALKDARANGYKIIGNFHSHPESPSRPSEEDKRLAFDPTIEYLILSLMEEGNLPLDELIAHFRQGTEAAKNCYHLLQKAENDITILTEEVSRLADTGKEEKQNECTECIEGKTENN